MAHSLRGPAAGLQPVPRGANANAASQDQLDPGLGQAHGRTCRQHRLAGRTAVLDHATARGWRRPAVPAYGRRLELSPGRQRADPPGQNPDPPVAARCPGGLPHPGQRPAADRPGAGHHRLDRRAFGAGAAGRPRSRSAVRRHRPDPQRRLVHQPVPGQTDPGSRPRCRDQGHQGTAARHPRQGPRLWRLALPGR
ncbi:hypothetical protein D3C84_612530 [compost metagenome]